MRGRLYRARLRHADTDGAGAGFAWAVRSPGGGGLGEHGSAMQSPVGLGYATVLYQNVSPCSYQPEGSVSAPGHVLGA